MPKTTDDLLAVDAPSTNGAMLQADDCMTLGPEGDPCSLKEFHPGPHSWQVQHRSFGASTDGRDDVFSG
jgi:hypothetical protein